MHRVSVVRPDKWSSWMGDPEDDDEDEEEEKKKQEEDEDEEENDGEEEEVPWQVTQNFVMSDG